MSSDLAALLLATFREEASDGIERLEASLVRLSNESDPELVGDLFRVAHTIKGGAGSFGLTAMTRLAHRMESLLDRFRGGAAPTPGSIAALLDATDALRELLRSASPLDRTRGDIEQRLEQESGALSGAVAPAPPAAAIRLRVEPTGELFRAGVEPALLLEQLGSLGELTVEADASRLPAFDDLDPTTCYLAWSAELRGTTFELAASLFDWLDGLCAIRLDEPAAAPAPAPRPVPVRDLRRAAPVDAAAPATAPAPSASIRVRVDKLDSLMNLIGDLVLTQSTLCALDRGADAASRPQRQAALDSLARLTRALQENALQLRSMPIGQVFRRFPRMVHDLAAQLGKQVELEVVGEMTELDRTVLERIGEPLLHLLRNSIDHGLELPAVREAAGKPVTGLIRMSAEQRGGEVLIEIADDGRGLDRTRILDRARSRGLVPADRTPADHEIDQFIFLPGFSTAEQVSEVSGRGVGMDVVARTIQQLGGDLRLQSFPGEGTTISLRLPMSLAIIDGQLVRFGGRTWVVPLPHIIECAQPEPAAMTLLCGARPLYHFRDEPIPVVDLCKHFALDRGGGGATKLLLVVEANGQRRALLVDEVGARQQVVIKSLGDQLAPIGELGGATILGDGSIAFILDVPNLCGGATRTASRGMSCSEPS